MFEEDVLRGRLGVTLIFMIITTLTFLVMIILIRIIMIIRLITLTYQANVSGGGFACA